MNLDPLQRAVTDPQMERVCTAMSLLRKMDSEMPAQLVCSLFYIASHNHCHKQALEEDLQLTVAAGSRNTDWLSDDHRLDKPGLGLITKQRDPNNGRRLQMVLTPKGQVFVNQIKDVLFGNQQKANK